MATKYLKVTFRGNYADEFDLNGWWFCTEKSFKAWEQLIKKYVEYPVDKYFGTNENVIYENSEEYLRCIKSTEITKTQYESVLEIFESEMPYPTKRLGDFIDPAYDGAKDETPEVLLEDAFGR